MKRRKFLIGAGALAAGGAAALGSGAFTSVEADRDISVEVTGDNNALVRLTPVVHRIENVPNEDRPVYFDGGIEDGTLGIDTSRSLASGVNANAVTWLGTPNFDEQSGWVGINEDNIDWAGDHTYTPRAAFGIENRGTQEYDLTFEYQYANDPGDSEITFEFYDGAAPALGNSFPRKIGTLTGNNSVSVKAGSSGNSFRVDKRIFSSVRIDTGAVGDDLSGALTIRAE